MFRWEAWMVSGVAWRRSAIPGTRAPFIAYVIDKKWFVLGQADNADGAVFSRFTRSLFKAFTYAFTDATMVSVSAP